MASSYKMKGIFKAISQIFAVKEQEMEIGNPTDVKHVAHIGWNSSVPFTGNPSPSWMDGVRGSSDYSSLGNFAAAAHSTGISWTSLDFDHPHERSSIGMVLEIAACAAAAVPSPDVPRPPPMGKTRRRGKKATAAGTSASPAAVAGAVGTQ